MSEDLGVPLLTIVEKTVLNEQGLPVPSLGMNIHVDNINPAMLLLTVLRNIELDRMVGEQRKKPKIARAKGPLPPIVKQ